MKLFLIGVAVVVVVLGGAGFGGYTWVGSQVHTARRAGRGAVTVTIPPGTSVGGVATLLHDAGLVDSTAAFELYVRWSGLADKLQAGTYRVPAGLTEVQLIQLLERNTGGTSVTLTVPEGWTPGQIGRAAEAKGLFSAAAYLDVVQHGSFSDTFLAGRPAGADLTGYLFPDTYYLAPDAKPADLVQLQLRRFGEVVTPELRARAQVQGLTFHQALTMASIIEREAAFAEDRAPIAQVFYNRLAAGMPLQDDATLLFAKGVTSGIPTDADKQVNSPYNTYLHTGLPPGPICNPGLAAIQAALNPTPNDYLYFITDNAGHAHFARTLAEHEALIARYGVH